MHIVARNGVLVGASILVAVVLAPLFASAQSPEQQIAALREQIVQLQERLQQLVAQTSASSAGLSAAPPITRMLSRGASGEDVRRLQEFLARDRSIYPEGIVSGFFGELTERAVQRYQARYGIVSDGDAATTGFGMVGPRTLAFLRAAAVEAIGSSAASTRSTQTFPEGGVVAITNVSPVSGGTTSPAVTIGTLTISPNSVLVGSPLKATVGIRRECNGARDAYTITWGDGKATTTVAAIRGGTAQCEAADMLVHLSHTHTYTKAGTYTVTLTTGGIKVSKRVTVESSGQGSYPGVVCPEGEGGVSSDSSVGDIVCPSGQPSSIPPSGGGQTIEDSGSNAYLFGTLALSPSSVAVGATLKATVGIRESCSGDRDAYTIDWGDGSAKVSVPRPAYIKMVGCEAADMPVYLSHTHTYTRAGTYTVTLTTGGKTTTQQIKVGS